LVRIWIAQFLALILLMDEALRFARQKQLLSHNHNSVVESNVTVAAKIKPELLQHVLISVAIKLPY